MIYSTNPRKQRRYDRTDYQLEPFWIERRPVRIRRTLLAVVVPLALSVLAYFWAAGGRLISAFRVGDDRVFSAQPCAVARCDS